VAPISASADDFNKIIPGGRRTIPE